MAFHKHISSQLDLYFPVAPEASVILGHTSCQAHRKAVVAPFGPFRVHQMGAGVPTTMDVDVPWPSQFLHRQRDGDVGVGHRRFSRLDVDRPPFLLSSADTDADVACDDELRHDVLRFHFLRLCFST